MSVLAAALAFSAMAQGSVTLTTDAPVGTKIRLLPNAKSTTAPIRIDFGNGVAAPFTVDPTFPQYQRWIEATVEGPQITITGDLTELTLNNAQITSATVDGMTALRSLDLSDNIITDFELIGTTPLVSLDLSGNRLTNSTEVSPTLTLENAGATLSTLDISENSGLVCLDMRHLTGLTDLKANDCPDFTSIFICLPEEAHQSLRSINLSNCSLAHFYPIGMPKLTSLDLSNNELETASDVDPFELGDYPALRTLNLAENEGIDRLDVTACTNLEKIDISNCSLTSLDLSQCPALTSLTVPDNYIANLDLGNNTGLTAINVSGNPISELATGEFVNLRNLNISDTRISRIELMKAYFLTTFEAASTQLEFVDFNGVQPGGLTLVDLRYNKRMTGESVDYTIHTLPQAKSSYNPDANLLLRGSNGETADISYATSSDMMWKCDITGDATSSHTPVPVVIEDATDTGENITGRLDRLYPNFGIGLDYDLDRYTTQGGDFLIAQWQPVYFQTIKSVSDQAYPGVPMHIYPYPHEGKRFRSVTVNGTEIFSRWFMVSGPATIKVNFVNEENSISFTTTPGQDLSFIVNTAQPGATVYVDWGTGIRTPYTDQLAYTSGSYEIKGTRIDGKAAAERITVYGDIAAIDLSGFGDSAEWLGLHDNHVTSIDLTDIPDLRFLNLYWNPVSHIDLSPCRSLEFLNVGFTNLKQLDLSHTPSLMWLEAYSDGFGFEEDGISMLSAIDVTALPFLRYLDVKANELTELDLTHNPMLRYLYANSNSLTSIDLLACTELEELNLAQNSLTSIDLAPCTSLSVLSVDGNSLSDIDLSHNTWLTQLSVANNSLSGLDTSMLTYLNRLYINGNGFTADELNDIYYLLPERIPTDDTYPGVGQVSYNLAVIQGGDREENDGLRADSSIAVARGWTPSHTGTNGGSDVAYLDITSDIGDITVTDERGNTYTHGSKVPKYTPLTIVPNTTDLRVVSFSLNGEEPREGNTFDMPGVYTRLNVQLAATDALDAVSATGARITPIAGVLEIYVPQDAAIAVYTTDGRCIASATLQPGTTALPLPSGVCHISLSTSGATATRSVLIP